MQVEDVARLLQEILKDRLDNGSVLGVENNRVEIELGDDEEVFTLVVVKDP